MIRSVRSLAVLTCCFVLLPAVSAEVRLPSILGSNMVLQRGQPVPIWGWSDPGDTLNVSFAGQTKTTKADESGRWRVDLDALEASAQGQTLTVAGKSTVTLKNVLVGEVWICSGQSNMEWNVGGALNGKQEVAAAEYPSIRLFNVPGHITAPSPKENCPGKWDACSPRTVGGFSAVGYFFGRRLHKELKVPIGLVGSNWGGTRIEPWTPPVGFQSVPQLKALADAACKYDVTTEAGRKNWDAYIQQVEAWLPTAKANVAAGKAPSPVPATPGLNSRGPTAIYNAMIHPLAPYAVRGTIWYQGESNGGEGESYFHKMQALIQGWRKVWGQDMGFYFVQLANFRAPNQNPEGGDGWAKLREAQRKALTIPHTGMAVATDIGNARDIHPRNKQDVGDRLAQWALHQTYKRNDVVPSGPLYKSHKVVGNAIRIEFDHVGSGLMAGVKEGLKPVQEAPDAKLGRWAIAGKDKKWHWADAMIEGNAVVVSCAAVTEPVAVRYAFSTNTEGANLYNKEGLPASPFRTDDW